MFWTMVTLGVAVSLQLPRMPALVAVATVLPFMWRVAAELRNWGPLPAYVRFPALAIALLALFLSYGDVFGRTAAVSLLSVMLALKLLETYKLRDARVIVSFSLFLCATQYLFGQGVLMPLYGATVIATSLIALAHLHRREAFPPVKPVPALGRSIYSELGFSFRVLLLALPASIALFVLFPRWSAPFWGVPESSLDAQTGLSDSMSPGSIQQLFMDDSAAFRVSFEGRVPPQSELYWRGPVFWEYDGQEWTRSFWSQNIEVREMPDPAKANLRYTVQLEPNERHWLFALDYPANTPPETRMTMDFQILRKTAITQLLRYEIASDPEFIDTPSLSAVLSNSARELPSALNPRTRELVREWRETMPDDRALAQQVLDYFNEQPFHYSLDAPLLGLHAVDDFIFGTRTGYCEHYASAFTVMMRMAGIPARVVTGYQGGWYNEFGDYLLVRQSDAHAWSEIWLEGSGWTRVDPTAAVSPLRVQSGSLGALSEPRHLLDYEWLRSVKNGFDVFQRGWNDWVIDYNASRQARLLSPLGIPQLGPAGLMVVLAVVLAVVVVLLIPVILRIEGPMRRSPLQNVWFRFLGRLGRAGVKSTPAMGAGEIAQSAAKALPEDSEEIFRIAQLYNEFRYSPSPPDFSEIKHAVATFRPKRQAG